MSADEQAVLDRGRVAGSDETPGSARVAPSTGARWFVAAVLGLALTLRIGVVVADDGYQPINDSLHFDLLATSLANGDGFQPALFGLPGPSAYRAPLYPASLAAVYAVAGDHSWKAGRLANAAIGTVLVLLIGVVASQLWGRKAAAVALVLAAVHPTLLLHGSSLMSEPLMATLVMASLAAALRHRSKPVGFEWAVAAGALAGLATLTRETGFLLVAAIALLVWTGRRARAQLVPSAVVLLAALAVVAPWTIRNAARFDTFVPVSTSGGYSFAGTFNDTARHNPTDPAIWVPPETDPRLAAAMGALEQPDEVSLDRVLREEALTYARDNPGYLLEVVFWNTVRFFDLNGPRAALEYSSYVPYPIGLARAAVYASWFTGALGVVGLLTGAGKRWPVALWAFPALAFGLHVVLSANIRYRALLEPFTVLLAAFAVTQIHTRLPARSPQR